MTKDEKMRVLTATAIIILIITGLFSLGMTLVANKRYEADMNGIQAVATITDLSVKKGEKVTTVQYFSNDDAWTAELGEKDLKGKYELWDSIYIYYHKDDASKLLTQYSLIRLQHMITALIIIAIVSIVGGCCMVKPMILDWDKRFIKPAEAVATRRKTRSYSEDLDLFDNSGYQEQVREQRRTPDGYYDYSQWNRQECPVRYDQYGRPIANRNSRAQQNSGYSRQNNVRY